MVYTEERLKLALDLFRETEPYRKRRGLPGSNLGRLLESRSKKYETRSGQSSSAFRTTYTRIWNDKDDGDDYKPGRRKSGTKSQKSARGGSKRKLVGGSGCGGNPAPKRSRAFYTTGRQKGMSLEVRFKFKSDAAKAKVAELFPLNPSESQLDEDGHYMSDHDGEDPKGQRCSSICDGIEASLFSVSPVAPSPSPLTPAPFLQDHDLRVQGMDYTKTAVQNDSSHHRLPTACESDPITIDDSDDSQTGDCELLDSPEVYKQAIQTKVINTNWAHPIDYRCKPEVCNFCQDFRYSLFGCGAVKIEVLQLEPGLYEEMGGGHRERGIAPTNICLNCSLERIVIAKCPGHEVFPIDGYIEEDFDYQSFLDHVATSPYPAHPNCSVCIKPAFYACGRKQKEDAFGFPITGEDVDGCGLLLCSDCAGVVASCGLKMNHLEGFAENNKILRADRDFLLPGSDLWQAWKK